MDLFAERGYHATSVADIQTAAGLTGGSGALYKHFASKQALLDAGVETYLAELASHGTDFVRELPVDAREALEAIAHGVLESMTADEPVIRVLLRDLDQHPALLNRVWDGVLENVYSQMSQWIKAQAARGTIVAADPAATAAVLMSALTCLPIVNALIQKTPGGLSPAAFASAWVDVAANALHLRRAG